MIEKVMRVDLIGPFRVAGIGIARENCRGPEIVATALVGIPGALIGGSVVNQVELGIIGDPAPYRAAAHLPSIGGPACDTQVLALETVVEGLEVVLDKDAALGCG